MMIQIAPLSPAGFGVEHGTTGRACDDSARKENGGGSLPASRTVPGGALSFGRGCHAAFRALGRKSRMWRASS